MALAASAGVAQWANGQDERLTVEVGECVGLSTPEQRLACFEAQVESARGTPAVMPGAASTATPPAAGTAAPVTTTTIAVPASAAPPEFGFRERRPQREDAPPAEIHAKVAELRETVPNSFLITLDNGQVWRQTRPDRHLILRVGQDVRIFFSRWRTYRLDSPQTSGFLQVERVR